MTDSLSQTSKPDQTKSSGPTWLERAFRKPKNPYLQEGRLALVIAAIQSLGGREWGSSSLSHFVLNIQGGENLSLDRDPNIAPKAEDVAIWKRLFDEHPEFFKLYSVKKEDAEVGLVWRHVFPVNVNPRTGETLSFDKLNLIKKDQQFYRTYTRRPMTSDEIEVLINTAIEMHSRAIAQRESSILVVIISGCITNCSWRVSWCIFWKEQSLTMGQRSQRISNQASWGLGLHEAP